MARDIKAIEWIVQNGNNAGELLQSSFDGGRVIKVGRLSSAHLYLSDASVSRMHAVIEKRPDGALQLIDLGSAAGTYVNGEKITKSELRGGDIVCFGNMELIVRFGGAEKPATLPRVSAEVELATAPMFELGEQDVVEEEVVEEDSMAAEPYTLQGYYDEHGNYIPGYYDDQGAYHLGYGYWDEAGDWCVAYGYYDPDGEWVEDDLSLAAGEEEARGDIYSSHCFGASAGDTLEIAMLWSDQVLSVNQYTEARDVTIGRKIGNYIQLIDDNVSRVHVKVRGTAQGVEVTDQKSNQGTMVNDDKLVANVPQMLQNGDKLKIGDNVFIFHAQADFGTNHGLTEQKVAGQAQNRATAAMGQLDWKSELSATLMKAGGDKEKAAEMMGLSPEVFEKMLEQAQKDS